MVSALSGDLGDVNSVLEGDYLEELREQWLSLRSLHLLLAPWASSNIIVSDTVRLPLTLVQRGRLVANVLSMWLLVRPCRQCSAAKS